MRAALNTHNHHDGASHHKDIRLFLTADDGMPTVVHFSSAGGLPGPGRIGRWRALETPHIHDHEERVDRSAQGLRGHERITFESHDDADLHEHEGQTGITYLSVGGSRYAISGGAGGVHFVKNLDSAEKVAFLDGLQSTEMAQVWLVERARQMGLIPPDNAPQNPQVAQQALLGGLQSALGTGLKTVSLSFLGGLGAGTGWTLGKRLAGASVSSNEKEAANEDPANFQDAPGESPADYRPENPTAFKPADAAATKAHASVEHRFGYLPNDPL